MTDDFRHPTPDNRFPANPPCLLSEVGCRKSSLGSPRGRLAPSPTGALHLGNARTFLIAWLRMRVCGGKIILRMEDLDHPKVKPNAATEALEDLRWLGLDWD